VHEQRRDRHGLMRRVLLLLGVLVALAGCGGPPATPPPAAPVPADVAPAPVADPTGLTIPTIGVHVDGIARLELDEHGALEIPQDAGTVGWYPLGPAPGEVGPAILTGHVNYSGTPGVFARLHELKAGDQIGVLRADGTTAQFVVYAVNQYPKADFPSGEVYGDTAEPVLRLITCGGELDKVARSYRDNVVVSARLVA
jgi:sortase (surface protein transpeptidase)